MKPQPLCRFGLFILALAITSPAAAVMLVRCSDNPDHSVTNCRIDQPVVTSEASNGRRYPEVVFRPGDLVTVTAGGCVQTGGVGDTWKRFVDPTGPNSNRLYYATIRIPGSPIPRGSVAQLSAWINKPISVLPGVAAPDNVLILGYKDDDYSDNGYTGHDDGTDGQCRMDRDGGPAWIALKIEHGRGGTSAAIPSPFDIVADTVDANGLPLNPRWGWEASPDSRNPPHSNGKQSPTEAEPNPSKLCDGFPYIGDSDTGINLGSPPCTSQIGSNSLDVPSGANDLGCDAFGPPSGHLHGHVNWWPATVNGVIAWGDHTTGLIIDSDLKEHHGDDDYCFYLYPHNISLLTTVQPNFIEAEMDSDETIDHMGSQWWTAFHKAVDDSAPGFDSAHWNTPPWGDTPATRMISWKEASITGLVNIDQEHDGHSELHPIYAMTVHLNFGDTNDDRWAVFARNWGNEGFCSQDQHYWEVPAVSVFIPEPVPSSDYTLVEEDLYSGGAVTAHHGKVPGGMVINFDLGAPDNRAMVDGSLGIRWTPSAAAAGGGPTTAVWAGGNRAGRPAPTRDQMVAAGRAAKRGETAPDVLKDLSPEKRTSVLQQLKTPAPQKNAMKVQMLKVAMPQTSAPRAMAKIAQPKMRTVRDTARAEREKHALEVLCAAYDGHIPGLPKACRAR
jgi:hypothetical protein